MFPYLNLIALLSFTLAGDALFNVAIIWRVLSQGGSSKILGFFLCLTILLTFILQRISGRFKKMLEKNPRLSFSRIRVAGMIFSMVFVILLWRENIVMLYLAGMIFSVLGFLSAVTVEAIMGEEVLAGRLSSNKASRILQTAMQIAAFLGASMAGFVLSVGGMKTVLILNFATYASGAFLCVLLSRNVKDIPNSFISSQQSVGGKNVFSGNQIILWLSFLGLFLLTVQIASFNFLVPQIAQYERFWTASQFGFLDAVAGLGAFLCTILLIEKSYIEKTWVFAFAGILLGDVSFHVFNNIYIVAISVFMLGFSVNAFRIKQREFMYNSVSTSVEIIEWSGRISAMTAIVKAFSPLVLAYLIQNPSYSFMLCGFFVSAGVLLIVASYLLVKRKMLGYAEVKDKLIAHCS